MDVKLEGIKTDKYEILTVHNGKNSKNTVVRISPIESDYIPYIIDGLTDINPDGEFLRQACSDDGFGDLASGLFKYNGIVDPVVMHDMLLSRFNNIKYNSYAYTDDDKTVEARCTVAVYSIAALVGLPHDSDLGKLQDEVLTLVKESMGVEDKVNFISKGLLDILPVQDIESTITIEGIAPPLDEIVLPIPSADIMAKYLLSGNVIEPASGKDFDRTIAILEKVFNKHKERLADEIFKSGIDDDATMLEIIDRETQNFLNNMDAYNGMGFPDESLEVSDQFHGLCFMLSNIILHGHLLWFNDDK